MKRFLRLLLSTMITSSLLTLAPTTSPAQDAPAEIAEYDPEKSVPNPPEVGDRMHEIGTLRAKFAKPADDVAAAFDAHLSLLNTEVEAMRGIRFSEFLNVMAQSFAKERSKDSTAKAFTKERLFRQLWDSEGKHPGWIDPVPTPHCDQPRTFDPNGFAGTEPLNCERFEVDLGKNYTGTYSDDPTKQTEHPFSDDAALSPFLDDQPYGGADSNPDMINSYTLVAVSNRLDLFSVPTPQPKGKFRFRDCGEIRLVFARNSGVSVGTDNDNMKFGDRDRRNIIAFEARIPNPGPTIQKTSDYPIGCEDLQRFFVNLSAPTLKNSDRAILLNRLVLYGEISRLRNGLPKVISKLTRPIADYRNYTFDTKKGLKSGQIRTDQFLNKRIKITTTIQPPPVSDYAPPPPPTTTITLQDVPSIWTLREFRLKPEANWLVAVPAPIASTISPKLLRLTQEDLKSPEEEAKARLFMNRLLVKLDDLFGGIDEKNKLPRANDFSAINLATSPEDLPLLPFESISSRVTANADESIERPGDLLANYLKGLGSTPLFTTPMAEHLSGWESKLPAGTSLKIEHAIDRLRTQSCAGCHQFSDTQTPPIDGKVFGFDPPGGLGLGATWPNKACGDVQPQSCSAGDKLSLAQNPNDVVPNKLGPLDNPPMQFTHISERILTRASSKEGTGWRYAISLTADCLLRPREKLMRRLFGLSEIAADSNCTN